MQDVETGGKCGESESKEQYKEEDENEPRQPSKYPLACSVKDISHELASEDDGKTKAIRRVPNKYKRYKNVQDVVEVAKSKAKAKGSPEEYVITKRNTYR